MVLQWTHHGNVLRASQQSAKLKEYVLSGALVVFIGALGIIAFIGNSTSSHSKPMTFVDFHPLGLNLSSTGSTHSVGVGRLASVPKGNFDVGVCLSASFAQK
jgi:hypothetical protein